MSVVEGFAGMRVQDGCLVFNPFLPGKWSSFSFKIGFRGVLLTVKVAKDGVNISNESAGNIDISVYGQVYTLTSNSNITAVNEFRQ